MVLISVTRVHHKMGKKKENAKVKKRELIRKRKGKKNEKMSELWMKRRSEIAIFMPTFLLSRQPAYLTGLFAPD